MFVKLRLQCLPGTSAHERHRWWGENGAPPFIQFHLVLVHGGGEAWVPRSNCQSFSPPFQTNSTLEVGPSPSQMLRKSWPLMWTRAAVAFYKVFIPKALQFPLLCE